MHGRSDLSDAAMFEEAVLTLTSLPYIADGTVK